MLIFADVGALDRETLGKVAAFVERGGVLLRFAGSRLAAGNDDLVPVRLRRGGRNLGGTLSWDTPRTFAPFTRESPFFGLPIPADLGVRRQILAEPEGDLTEKTWAALQDGTPIVTAGKRGEGLVVLFHVTADTTWSNLPLSGLFVDMLRRVVGARRRRRRSRRRGPQRRRPDGRAAARARRLRLLCLAAADRPPGLAPPRRARDGRASAGLLRPGRFEPRRQRARDRRQARAARPRRPQRAASRRSPARRPIDLRAPLFTRGAARAPRRHARLAVAQRASRQSLRPHAAGGLGGGDPPRRARVAASRPTRARRSGRRRRRRCRRTACNRRSSTRLAYVVTGDAQTDATSKAGLVGLTQVLASRTALEPGEPIGVDPSPRRARLLPAALLADRRRAGRCRARPRSAASTPS